MSKIDSELLDIFLENQDVFLTSKYLAEELDSSDKTIRKYITILNDKLIPNGAVIDSKQGYGFKFDVIDKVLLNNYLKELKTKRFNFDNIENQIIAPEDREKYVLNKLLLKGEHITSYVLSQELYLSRTSISNILNGIKSKFLPYNLILDVTSSGITIVGREEDKRHFIKEYFFSNSFNTPVFSLFEDEILEKEHLSEIVTIVIDECRNSELNISDFIIHNLVIHLALMVKRLKMGKVIKYPSLKLDETSLVEYKVANCINKKLSLYFGIDFPEQETDFIKLHLIGARTNSNESNLALRDNILDALVLLETDLGVSISVDEHLLQNVESHIRGLIVRLNNGIQLANPLKNSILKKYDSIVQSISNVFINLPELKGYNITDDEWVYISLHILATLEKNSSTKIHRILLVCATGIGSARFLKNRIEKIFKDKIVIEDVGSYFDLSTVDLSRYDCIVSSIDLSNLFLPIPIIHVNVLLEKEDIRKIELFIDSSANNLEIERENSIGLNLFEKNKFIYLEKKLSKSKLLNYLIKHLDEELSEDDIVEFIHQVELRENLGAIVFDDVIAFPHPMKPLTKKEEVVVCVSKYPISWNTQNNKVQIIFLISPSILKNENLKLLSPIIAEFADRKENHVALLNNPTFETFITLINN